MIYYVKLWRANIFNARFPSIELNGRVPDDFFYPNSFSERFSSLHLSPICSVFRIPMKALVHQTGHKGVALIQLCKALTPKTCCGTNCLWCNWGLRPFTRAYIGLYVKMFKEQWISISGCKIAFGTHLRMLSASLNNNKKRLQRHHGL